MFRATLDEGPMSKDQWIQTILVFKASNWSQGLLDEGAKPKNGPLKLNIHGIYFGGKINWFKLKNSATKRALDLENQESS